MKPTLSICIPTYNRSTFLKTTIQSIVNQHEFQNTNNIEIIVSDNASTDDTEELCKHFVTQFPYKFIYHRNTENILDNNYEVALSLGRGKYLKLNNDTLIHNDGSLSFMVNTINNTDLDNELLIFNFGNKSGSITLNTTDELVNFLDYFITWIAIFGLSANQFKYFFQFFDPNSRLGQVIVLLEASRHYKIKVVDSQLFFESKDPIKKGGYDLITVFVENYISILRKYAKQKTIKRSTIRKQRKKVIFNLVCMILEIQLIKNKHYYFEHEQRRKRIVNALFPNILLIFRYLLFELDIIIKSRFSQNSPLK